MKKVFPVLAFIVTCGLSWVLTRFLRKRKNVAQKMAPSPFYKRKISVTEAESNKYWYEFFQKKPEAFFIIALGIFSLFLGDFMKEYAYFFKASLLNLPKTEFTGTVSPVEKVPKWTALTTAEYRSQYSQIPASKFITLPDYNISDFVKGKSSGNATDAQRNAYVTYPVPNLGNYQLDGTENSGSHPGIDIKIPIGTPIRSIANGVVYKTDYQETGFGNYVSIAHSNVPDPNDPQKKITIISNYAHLSKVLVKEGQIVNKGDVIGNSGESGMATAPHLHFQIDRENAPFHPYWPFTWNEVREAGISSYFEAVTAGLGKSNAQKYTIHSINFVDQFEEYGTSMLVTKDDETSKTLANETGNTEDQDLKTSAPKTTDPTPTETVVDTNEKTTTDSLNQANNNAQLKLTFETDRGFVPGQEEKVWIHVNEEALVASAGTINLSSTLRNKTIITPPNLTKRDFDNGSAEITVKTDSDYSYKLIASGEFEEVKSKSLHPEIFDDVPYNHTYADAIKYLKDNKVISGYADNTFKPENSLNRAEALKIILVANKFSIEDAIVQFADVPHDAWFRKYVGTAVSRGIVKGYSDGTFKPGKTVNRAEFLKMAILTAGFSPKTETRDPYPDVPNNAWFARYFQFAKDHQLLRAKAGGVMAPNDAITRAEAADVIYRLSKIEKR